MVSGVTLVNRGAWIVSMKKSGSSNRRTVLLGISMSGEKLLLFLILKEKPQDGISIEWMGISLRYVESFIYVVLEKSLDR